VHQSRGIILSVWENPDLQPEEMRSFEVAASYIITENAKVDLSVYKNELHDLIIQAQKDDSFMSVNKEMSKRWDLKSMLIIL